MGGGSAVRCNGPLPYQYERGEAKEVDPVLFHVWNIVYKAHILLSNMKDEEARENLTEALACFEQWRIKKGINNGKHNKFI